jgi:hypothetical protein
MTAALGLSARDLGPLVVRFMPECTTNGLSVIAVPVDDPDTLAGVFISRDFKSPMPDGIQGDHPWFNPIGEALMTVDEAYEAKRLGLVLGDAVDLWMVGVRPDSRFARRGIASTLFRVSADLAADSLYDYLAGAREYLDLVADQSEVGMKVVAGQQSYSARANWKLMPENSVDKYHALQLHQRYFSFLNDIGVDVKNFGKHQRAVDLGKIRERRAILDNEALRPHGKISFIL